MDALTRTQPLQKGILMAEGGIDTTTVDIPLPDEGAPQMVRDLHEANPSIPVLVMIALEDCAVHEQMLRSGADEVVEDAFTFAA
jgi:DNA-binding NarL/FixJ family response regulator